MTMARRFLSDEGHAQLGRNPGLLASMMLIAAMLIVIAIVGGCIVGAWR